MEKQILQAQSDWEKYGIFGQQLFYSRSAALQIDINRRGVYFSLAPSKGDKSKAYDWNKKFNTKLGISELCNILQALQVFRQRGEELYIKYCQSFFGEEKYKNMVFTHSVDNRVSMVGLNAYQGKISFFINRGKGQEYKFWIPQTDRLRLEKFIDFAINKAFEKGL